MALEECVSDLISFRQFFDEWRQELGTNVVSGSAGNEFLSAISRECESNADQPFEAFAAKVMGQDIVPELDTDCRSV